MRFYSGRLKRLEGIVGVTEEKMYLVVVGFREFDDCMAIGQPFFRSPEGRCHNIKALHEYYGGKLGNVLDVSKDDSKAILKRLGYDEIKSKDDMLSKYDNMSADELTKNLLKSLNG